MQDLLSVIVPVFNGESTIAELIHKILANPHKNVEILIGNDGSLDQTAKVLMKFDSHPQIKIVHFKENKGPGFTRNHLLKMATGNFIAMQDADDHFMTNRFVEQMTYLKENPDCDLVGTGASLVESNQIEWGDIVYKQYPNVLDWLLQRAIVHASIMFRSHLKEHARYNEDLKLGEDYFFLTTLYVKKFKIHNITKKLYLYNISQAKLRAPSSKRVVQVRDSIVAISKVFPIEQRAIFLFLNLSKLILRRLLRSVRSK